MLFAGWIYIVLGPWHSADFCNIFLPTISADQKKSYYIGALGPGTVSHAKYGTGYCIMFMKSLDEGLR